MAVKGIAIGMMNKIVVFATPETVVNDSGGRELEYNDYREVWAYVKQKSGVRTVDGMDGVGYTHEFYVRDSTDLSSIEKKWIIKYNNRRYIINNIEKISDIRPMLKIQTTERESLSNESDS